MESFIVRVELHGALTEAVYTQLHGAMATAGFSRVISADDGNRYWLPTAMYTISSSAGAVAVRQSAATAAATTRLSATVFAAKMDGWSSSGLVAYTPAR